MLLQLLTLIVPRLFSAIDGARAEKAALEGKSEGEILREVLAGTEETDRQLVATLVAAYAKQGGASRDVLADLDEVVKLAKQAKKEAVKAQRPVVKITNK